MRFPAAPVRGSVLLSDGAEWRPNALHVRTSKRLSIVGAHTAPRRLTIPDANGTVALLERAQTFSAAQTIAGAAPGSVAAGQVTIGGGMVWSAGNYVGILGTVHRYRSYSGSILTSFGSVESGLGYFGTESNHKLQIITNNLSRGEVSASGELIWGTDPGGSELVRVGGTVRCGKITGAAAVPGSFADLAAVQSFLAQVFA